VGSIGELYFSGRYVYAEEFVDFAGVYVTLPTKRNRKSPRNKTVPVAVKSNVSVSFDSRTVFAVFATVRVFRY